MKPPPFEYLRPADLDGVLAALAEASDETKILAGGQSLVPMMNLRILAPKKLVDINRVPGLDRIGIDGDWLMIGALARHTDVLGSPVVRQHAPLVIAAYRHIAHRPIRNRGTIGGNLGTSSPAGDAIPPLVVEGAEVECASVRGTRRIPILEFVTGVKRNVLAADELITAVVLTPSRAPQTFMKVGPRNAMVIAVVSLSVSAGDELRASFGSASARPAVVTAPRADASTFAERVAAAAAPIDDVRGTERYRRHALRVLTDRALKRVLA
jgi:CO/xanthine dehydrogenase FAD-binding subunit